MCFPVYAASRLIIREYQPLLDKLEITYRQYLVLMALWENNNETVSSITKKLILNTNTITPLLKRMQTQGLISRTRSVTDERQVSIKLTGKGKQLQTNAAEIPLKLIEKLELHEMERNELIDLRDKLNKLIESIQTK